MPRKQPLGPAEGEKEGERKKWCDVITRWTPGAERDTPGFIGLGTLRGPRYSVCASVHCWIHQLHTQLHSTLRSHNKRRIPIVWESPTPTDTNVTTATGKQTLQTHGMQTPHTQVKFAIRLSSPFLICRSVKRGAARSCHSRQRVALLMYGGTFVYSAEHQSRSHKPACKYA